MAIDFSHIAPIPFSSAIDQLTKPFATLQHSLFFFLQSDTPSHCVAFMWLMHLLDRIHNPFGILHCIVL